MDEQRRWNDQAIDGLSGRVEDVENEFDALKAMPEVVGRIDERVKALHKDCQERFDRVDSAHDKQSSFKSAMQFAAVIVVPIIIALIGGYFVLRAGIPGPTK